MQSDLKVIAFAFQFIEHGHCISRAKRSIQLDAVCLVVALGDWAHNKNNRSVKLDFVNWIEIKCWYLTPNRDKTNRNDFKHTHSHTKMCEHIMRYHDFYLLNFHSIGSIQAYFADVSCLAF